MTITPERIVEMCRRLAEAHDHRGLTPEQGRADYASLALTLEHWMEQEQYCAESAKCRAFITALAHVPFEGTYGVGADTIHQLATEHGIAELMPTHEIVEGACHDRQYRERCHGRLGHRSRPLGHRDHHLAGAMIIVIISVLLSFVIGMAI